MNIFELKKYNLITGRAGTGIYLILKANNFAGKRVLVPANICYAAIYPIIYADAIPVFCDVNLYSGNISLDIVNQYIDSVDAIIAPHMYGNPIKEINAIASVCKSNQKLLIEDCASAMGATIDGKKCGSFGDYSLFSTGYSKTVDLGGGGIVFSDYDLRELENIYYNLPLYSDQIEIDDSFFSKMYRLIRNNESQKLSDIIWRGLKDNLKYLYLYQDHRFNDSINNIEGKLNKAIIDRRCSQNKYEQLIRFSNYVYRFLPESVPWRFCMLIPAEKKRRIIDKLLQENIPVSDWYPVVTPIFGEDKKKYHNAYCIEQKIINFPLLINDKEIQRICECVNKILEMEK